MAKPTIYSIPVHRAFADALAAGIIARYGDGALGLAEGLILLPSNRARSAVQAAFVRAGGQGLLMPRFAVIGDADLDESVALALDAIDDDPIPPAIDPCCSVAISSPPVRRLLTRGNGTARHGRTSHLPPGIRWRATSPLRRMIRSVVGS